MIDLPTFVSSNTFKVLRGHAFVVKLDRTTYDFEHIIGKEIVINGKSYIGLDVSKYANVPPWHMGSPIAILARRNFMKTSVVTSNIIRWLIGCALLFGVYSETGGWTTFVIFLLFLNDEARRFTKNMQQKTKILRYILDKKIKFTRDDPGQTNAQADAVCLYV